MNTQSSEFIRSWNLATMDLDAIKPIRDRSEIPWHLQNYPEIIGEWTVTEKPFRGSKAVGKCHFFVTLKCSCGFTQKSSARRMLNNPSNQCASCASQESGRRLEKVIRGGK